MQGWSQRPGIDCGATFAPVCRIESQRLLLAISTQHDWDIYMLDVKRALIQSKIDEEVFVKQAPGCGILEAATGIPMVMKLKQAVYGLRTASRVWYLTLDEALKTIDFTSTNSASCLYIYEMEGGYVLFSIYVDDILFTGPEKNLLGQLKEKLMARFSMTDLGEVSLILGMKITRDRSKRTLRISLTDYTRSILDRFNMKDCNPVSTPSTGAELSLNQPTNTLLDEDGVKLYQSMVGTFYTFQGLHDGTYRARY